MTLPFQEKIVNGGDFNTNNFYHPNFIGFLNPYGKIIDYSKPFGLGGHDSNPSTDIVKEFFHMPEKKYLIDEQTNKEQEKKHAICMRERLKPDIEAYQRNCMIRKKYGINRSECNPYELLDEDLYRFFYRCYSAETFRDGLGKDCSILNEKEFFDIYCKNNEIYLPSAKEITDGYNDRIQRKVEIDYTFYKLKYMLLQLGNLSDSNFMSKEDFLNWCCKNKKSYFPRENETTVEYSRRIKRTFEYDYHWYKMELIVDWFKTIMVQYLHYHYVDRLGLGITTSSLTPNETFYNYKLNGFKIHQIPIMVWNSDKKVYEEYVQNEFFVPDSELRLNDEIQAIKKLVPSKDIAKYYR